MKGNDPITIKDITEMKRILDEHDEAEMAGFAQAYLRQKLGDVAVDIVATPKIGQKGVLFIRGVSRDKKHHFCMDQPRSLFSDTEKREGLADEIRSQLALAAVIKRSKKK